MKTIQNKRFKESYVLETLDNGLHVVLWKKKDFKKSFFLMATPLGALDLKQAGNGKQYDFPAGIAHFLEHKMFEDDDKDVMDAFSEMGANVNAFTSYSETAYYFSTTSDPIKPLHLLLDFVQNLNISEASVEKEKGIIIQELEMYQQMSDFRILNETLASLFHEHPLRFDIGGDNESVSATTKQQLEACYALNYHPSKMILIGVSGEDPQLLLDEIKANQQAKQFTAVNEVVRSEYHEKECVKRKEYRFAMDVSVPKVSIAFKLSGIEDVKARNLKEWEYKILFDLYFSSLNQDFQKWIDEEIINPSFSFEIDLGKDYGLIMFYTETKHVDAFEKMIMETLHSIKKIDESKLPLLRNRYFGLNINALNDQKQIAVTYMRDYFAGMDFFDSLEMVEQISAQDLLDALADINFEHCAKVIIDPIEQTR